MTTKYRIIAGFSIMIILLGGMAAFGYVKLHEASGGFVSYRLQARQNTLASDLSTAVSDMLRASRKFLMTFDPKDVDESLGFVGNFIKLSNSGAEMAQSEWRKKAFAAMTQGMEPIRQLLGNMRDSVLELRKAYNDEARKAYNAMFQDFRDLTQLAYEVNNMEIVFQINGLWAGVTQTVASLGRFSSSLEVAEATSARERLNGLQANIQAMGARLLTEKGRQTYASLTENYKRLSDSLARMTDLAGKTQGTVRNMLEVGGDLNKRIDELNARLDKEAQEEAGEVLAANSNAIRAMMVTGAAGLLLGAGLALYIVIGLVKALTELSGFAGAVARGDFNYQVRVREKGEVGSTIAAMKEIPEVLKGIIQSAIDLARAVRRGRLAERLEESRFTGEFARLAHAVNTVSDSYNNVVDEFPPLVASDKEGKIIFMNRTAQTIVGGDFRGEKCSSHLHAPECGTEKCLGRQTQQRGRFSEETQINAQGNVMDVSVTVMPIKDSNGEETGIYEFLTDISESKRQQRAVREVTGQAAEISNRMAAAAEELSAQVEQVSRGAEMQRERVESTASAMNEMNSTVLEVARNAGQASEQSENTRHKAEGGAELVNKVVRSINNVNAVAASLQDNMQELGSKAESIGGVMNVISDIADQTNLLALNAAIEAARAGEAGRGFAVVADEVRKLAEKTMSATQEVGGSITAIQQAARKNIEEVGTAAKSVSEATDLANSSGTALKEIVDLAAANSAVVTSIATAAEEQSATSEEINRAIDEINRVVSETTQGMVQSSAAVQELSQMAQELNTVMEKLK
ncbi:MAG: methyl-accepting chemotaxis protein, partial [Desulfovibrio sp.]|nr:methyl-accepting chemotaxis protein [Desulfovibrio sp.]